MLKQQENFIVSASADKSIKIWDMNTKQLVRTLNGHTNRICGISISPSNDKIVSIACTMNPNCYDIIIWNVKNGQKINTFQEYTRQPVIHFSINFNIISISNNNIKIYNDTNGFQLLQTLKGHTDIIMCIVSTSDKIITGSRDYTIKIWDTNTYQLIRTLCGHNSWVMCVSLSVDNSKIISSSSDLCIKTWDVVTGIILQTFSMKYWPLSVKLSTDNIKIISSQENNIEILNANTGKLLQTLTGHINWVTSITYSNNDLNIISGSYDNNINIWNTQNGQLVQTLSGHTEEITGIAVSHKLC